MKWRHNLPWLSAELPPLNTTVTWMQTALLGFSIKILHAATETPDFCVCVCETFFILKLLDIRWFSWQLNVRSWWKMYSALSVAQPWCNFHDPREEIWHLMVHCDTGLYNPESKLMNSKCLFWGFFELLILCCVSNPVNCWTHKSQSDSFNSVVITLSV